MELEVDTSVKLVNLPDIVRQVLQRPAGEEITGKIVEHDPSTTNYVVEVSGQRFVLPGENLEAYVEKYTLMTAMNAILEQDTNTPSNEDGENTAAVSTDVFDTEIERLFTDKIKRISTDLTTMKSSWMEVRDQKLGRPLTMFIDYALPYLDHLIVLVGTVHEESDLKAAMTAFEKMFKMSSEVANTHQVTAWVEMQLEQLDNIS